MLMDQKMYPYLWEITRASFTVFVFFFYSHSVGGADRVSSQEDRTPGIYNIFIKKHCLCAQTVFSRIWWHRSETTYRTIEKEAWDCKIIYTISHLKLFRKELSFSSSVVNRLCTQGAEQQWQVINVWAWVEVTWLFAPFWQGSPATIWKAHENRSGSYQKDLVNSSIFG